jgi:hypothetical protein
MWVLEKILSGSSVGCKPVSTVSIDRLSLDELLVLALFRNKHDPFIIQKPNLAILS